jgi:cob(I)alamin adenosyltransferase
MEKGFVHVYTGNGKGKTTSALGLALRAVGAGKKVYLGQFMKSGKYHEIKAIGQHLPMITVEQYGNGCLICDRTPQADDYAAAGTGLTKAKAALLKGGYDIVILDEINVAAHLGLIREQDTLDLIDAKPPSVELILTGRYATLAVINKADLVTEMTEVKHYYAAGVLARDGIER